MCSKNTVFCFKVRFTVSRSVLRTYQASLSTITEIPEGCGVESLDSSCSFTESSLSFSTKKETRDNANQMRFWNKGRTRERASTTREGTTEIVKDHLFPSHYLNSTSHLDKVLVEVQVDDRQNRNSYNGDFMDGKGLLERISVLVILLFLNAKSG